MSFFNFDLNNVPEETTVADGEYELRILQCEVTQSKKGDPMVHLRFEICGDDTAADINHYIMLPAQADDQKKTNRKLRNLRDFCQAFNIPTEGGIQLDDSLIGETGWAILTMETSDDYGDQNKIKRFVAGS